MKYILLLLLPLFVIEIYSQEDCIIASYNLLNYPGNDSAIRNPYFRTVMGSVLPDVLVVQEMTSQAGVDGFLNNVLNQVSSGYAAGTFINGTDTDNAIFYKNSKFIFLSNTPIHTELRDINEFKLVNISTSDTIRIYSLHLKASSGTTNEQQRAREVDSLRKVTETLPLNSNYLVVGDYNIYYSDEPAYQKLLNQTYTGYFLDPINRPGSWHNDISFADIHTQSPRTRQFGGGANGGMDDRFDMMLISQGIKDVGGIDYIAGSYTAYGNDGLHFNDSINRPPNAVVSQQIADAIHYSSDHIPVFLTLRFEQTNTQKSVSLNNGWNILSVPLLAPDMTGSTLFPTVVSPFYSFTTNYNQVTILENSKGYWAKFNGNQSQTISGTPVNSNQITVVQGWNLIGVYDFDIPTNSITSSPPNIISSPFYGYEVGYVISDTLKAGKGYWIKANSNGTLQLSIF